MNIVFLDQTWASERACMDIAVVGSGIAGLLAGRILSSTHNVTLYEANDYFGGHTHTIPVERAGERWNVDTGFIVFNEPAYPQFTRLLGQLNVPSRLAPMSFSVSCEASGLEYASTDLNSIFAQRLNLLRPRFWRMLTDISRFFREAAEVLDPQYPKQTLGEYVRSHRYSSDFIEKHLLPLGAAVWSADIQQMSDFPVAMFVRFFQNHGFMSINKRTPWRVVCGGSSSYIKPLIAPIKSRLRSKTPIASIRRLPDSVEIQTESGEINTFDEVVMAVHSPTALRLLKDSSREEQEILGAIRYQPADVVLHSDTRMMPRCCRAWASWNFNLPRGGLRPGRPNVTYWMNELQSLRAPVDFCVSLNRSEEIDPSKIIGRYTYEHPVYSFDAFRAQSRYAEIGGVRRTHFCGAYWGFGFHEDAVSSALRVAQHFGLGLDACTAQSTKVGSGTAELSHA